MFFGEEKIRKSREVRKKEQGQGNKKILPGEDFTIEVNQLY
jgi:hypothetical protein